MEEKRKILIQIIDKLKNNTVNAERMRPFLNISNIELAVIMHEAEKEQIELIGDPREVSALIALKNDLMQEYSLRN
jgi:hypothetical protein